MNTVEQPRPLTIPEKLALAQEAYQEFHAMCFWYLREDIAITEDDLPMVIKGLRNHGNRETFFIAARLCR